MFDFGGFLTSTHFLTQLAQIITAVLSIFFGGLISGLFGG